MSILKIAVCEECTKHSDGKNKTEQSQLLSARQVHYQVVLSWIMCEQLYHMSITQTQVLRQHSNMKQYENPETGNKKNPTSTQFYITCRLSLLLLWLNVQKGFFPTVIKLLALACSRNSPQQEREGNKRDCSGKTHNSANSHPQSQWECNYGYY